MLNLTITLMAWEVNINNYYFIHYGEKLVMKMKLTLRTKMVGAIFSGIETISKMWKSFSCAPKKDNAFFLKVHIKNVILGS